MTRARRTDRLQAEIVAALRQCGVAVAVTSSAGGGFPDLVCGLRGRTWLVEVKRPGGSLTADQRRFWETWRGEAYIVQSVAEALKTIQKPPQGA